MTPHLGFELDGVHIEGNLLYLKVQWHKRKNKGVGVREGDVERRRRGGGEEEEQRRRCSRT